MPVATKKSKSTSSIKLPTKPNVPPTRLGDYVLSIHGEKGIGKTTLASMMGTAVVIQLEERRRNLPIYQIPEDSDDPLDWDTLRDYLELIQDQKKFDTVVIDTVDKAYELCFDCICKDKGISHPNQIKDFGQTWREIKVEFADVFNQLIHSGKGIVFISHTKPRTIEEPDGTEYDLKVPACMPACFEYLKQVADVAMYLGYRNRKRFAQVRGNEYVWASCGCPDNFLTKEGDVIEALPLGSNPKEGLKNINDGFANKLSTKNDDVVIIEC